MLLTAAAQRHRVALAVARPHLIRLFCTTSGYCGSARCWRGYRATSRGYRDYRDRYRAMATSLGFEGHIVWAEAMP